MNAETLPEDAAERLMSAVEKRPNGCWDFVSHNSARYGEIRYSSGGRRRSLLAHRVSFALFNGPITEGACVCHSCDNTRCVNPDHLWIGTHAQNMEDKRIKGRASRNGRTDFSSCRNGHQTTRADWYVKQRVVRGRVYTNYRCKFCAIASAAASKAA